MKIFLLTTCFFIITGCATQAQLNINSQPMGAYITELTTETSFGIAPTSSLYSAKALELNVNTDGCYYVRGFRAKWVSGATATTKVKVRLCGSSTGSYNVTINRHSDDPDLDKDLNFAIKVKNTLAQQQQAIAAQNAALAQMWSTYSITQNKNSTTNCSSYMSGNILKTNCR